MNNLYILLYCRFIFCNCFFDQDKIKTWYQIYGKNKKSLVPLGFNVIEQNNLSTEINQFTIFRYIWEGYLGVEITNLFSILGR